MKKEFYSNNCLFKKRTKQISSKEFDNVTQGTRKARTNLTQNK